MVKEMTRPSLDTGANAVDLGSLSWDQSVKF
jgi:hypothetical protein